MSPTDEAYDLSVVIIGRNEGTRLERCIRSVQAQRGFPGRVEILYVDSDSTDGSPERAESLGARVLVVHPERPSAALGRNTGWRAARAPLILFLDGDTVLDPEFVVRTLPVLADPEIAVVWGHRRELHPEASVYNRVLDLDWIYPPGPSEFCGGDALMRRSALEEVGGFDPTLIAGEEPELCQRLRAEGFRIEHIDAPMTGHDLAIHHWRPYWRRAVRAGHAYAEIADRLRNGPFPLWSREVRRNRLHASALLLVAAAGLGFSLGLGQIWPLALMLALYLALVLRTAYRSGWKSRDPTTRFLYGIHSHLQQIPILFGQIGYLLTRRSGRRKGLIEYK